MMLVAGWMSMPAWTLQRATATSSTATPSWRTHWQSTPAAPRDLWRCEKPWRGIWLPWWGPRPVPCWPGAAWATLQSASGGSMLYIARACAWISSLASCLSMRLSGGQIVHGRWRPCRGWSDGRGSSAQHCPYGRRTEVLLRPHLPARGPARDACAPGVRPSLVQAGPRVLL